MRIIKTILLLLLIFGVVAGLFAFGAKETGDTETQIVVVSGRVRLVGSSPLTSLVISGENREWYVEPGEERKLMQLQQQIVTVEGREYYRDLTFVNGVSAGRRYFLKNIKIIEPKQ
ncbi:MAG: hypothetical protein LBH97_04290 [Treponema sp.]|jgi:hypothetical protein|nr:hypothetical protein [Treponema sp.]